MNVDDLRTLAYQALEALDGQKPVIYEKRKALFDEAKRIGLFDYYVATGGVFIITPIASKPATQVAGVQGFSMFGAMGERK